MIEDEFFKDKYALLDVNILSEMTKSKRAEKFRSVFEFLKNNNIEIFLTDSTCFEFVGFSRNKTNYDFLKNWIKKFPIIPTRENDIKLATLISSIYKCCHSDISPKQISYCDCLYAAQIVKFEGRAFLVTTNIHDYPVSLFDIKKISIIEYDGKAVFVAFMAYNERKWRELKSKFENSGYEKTIATLTL
ncbi:hypothetical protein KKA24_00840 [Patescibacteria group bacterium]|nr:hypothetical protein [Patescibacteria group bacterium]